MAERRYSQWFTSAAALALAAGFAYGTPVVVTDGLGDADRNNDGVVDGSAVSDAGDVGIKWLAMEALSDGTPNPAFTVVDDSAGIGSGNALYVDQAGSNFEMYAPLGQTISLGLDETMTISYDIRYEEGTDALSNAAQLRWGIFMADESYFNTAGPGEFGYEEGNFDGSYPGAQGDTGFQIRVNVGTSTSTPTIIEEFNIDTILGGSDTDSIVPSSAGGTLPAITDSLKHTITLVVTHTCEDVEGVSTEGTRISCYVDGVGNLSGFEPVGEGLAQSTFEWNYLAFNNTKQAEYFVDNLNIAITPEPASLALMGLGGLAVLRRR